MASHYSNPEQGPRDWTETVKPLPDGGGSCQITPLDGDWVAIEISGQAMRLESIAGKL